MSANEAIWEARLRLRLAERDVAHRAGLSWNAYWDLEHHEDEALEVVHLSDLKKVAQVLDLDLLELAGIRCAFCGQPASALPRIQPGRDALVRDGRESLGLSQEELAGRIGFERRAVEQMETDRDFLESWSVELVRNLADELAIAPQVLLGVRCAACGR